MDKNIINVGKYLKTKREDANLSQEELALMIGVGRDAIVRIEKGTRNITIDELAKLSNVLSFDISDLLNGVINSDKIIKGIILAGGSGTRLYPITEATSKQLCAIYDKPMIYYPLYVLMLAGIRDILIITTEYDQENFKRLLGDGSKFGINLSYEIQEKPEGLAQAFMIGEDFIGNDPCAMVLGDNIFFGNGLDNELRKAKNNAINGNATIFGYQVKDPERFGIMELDKNNNVISVEEKPLVPKSNYAITGLYFYPSGVVDIAKKIEKSARGEYEITSLNDEYLKLNKLKACLLGSGYSWFDTGTFDSMLEASNMIKTLSANKDMVICSPEEVAYDNDWLTTEELNNRAELLSKNSYGTYLEKLAHKKKD